LEVSLYALVDGNNFYVSCERVFRPDLQHRPVIVLSNNDGCAIARSNEAKELGVRMGHPWHEIRHLEKEAGLVALSANFALYGDPAWWLRWVTAMRCIRLMRALWTSVAFRAT